MSGFVVIQREALDHHIIGEPERFHAWCWLIATACWKPTRFSIKGQSVTLERGQLCVSRSQLAGAWKWSESAVERFLTRLKTEQMIGRATGQGRTIITICNYDKYQSVATKPGQATGQESGHKSDSNRTAKEPKNQIIPLPNGNGGSDFWAFAVAYLGEGRRSLIGKWRKDYGQAEVANAITSAQFANAVEPVAYIERTLRGVTAATSAGEMW